MLYLGLYLNLHRHTFHSERNKRLKEPQSFIHFSKEAELTIFKRKVHKAGWEICFFLKHKHYPIKMPREKLYFIHNYVSSLDILIIKNIKKYYKEGLQF